MILLFSTVVRNSMKAGLSMSLKQVAFSLQYNLSYVMATKLDTMVLMLNLVWLVNLATVLHLEIKLLPTGAHLHPK